MHEVRKWYQISPEMVELNQRQIDLSKRKELEQSLRTILTQIVVETYKVDDKKIEEYPLDALLYLTLLSNHPTVIATERTVGPAADVLNVPSLVNQRNVLLNGLNDMIVRARDRALHPNADTGGRNMI